MNIFHYYIEMNIYIYITKHKSTHNIQDGGSNKKNSFNFNNLLVSLNDTLMACFKRKELGLLRIVLFLFVASICASSVVN